MGLSPSEIDRVSETIAAESIREVILSGGDPLCLDDASLARLARRLAEIRHLRRLRIHTRTGRPLGDDTFLSKLETFLGRRVRALPRGRPKGSTDKTKRKPRTNTTTRGQKEP